MVLVTQPGWLYKFNFSLIVQLLMNAYVGVATGCNIVRKHVVTGLKLPSSHLHFSEYILNKEQTVYLNYYK